MCGGILLRIHQIFDPFEDYNEVAGYSEVVGYSDMMLHDTSSNAAIKGLHNLLFCWPHVVLRCHRYFLYHHHDNVMNIFTVEFYWLYGGRCCRMK